MRRRMAARMLVAALWAGATLLPPAVRAEDGDLMELSLEELASYRITSVSKQAEPLGRSAAAVYVITREEMRRSGYTSVAEALRMVPGVQVARQNSHAWAIGARGFNTGLSNKLLVLIDGRSVYSPLFSGVFWELRDVPVEDIDRIEVIRGPGASLWGANAVNGVINIITRPAAEAAGITARAGGGSEEQGFGLLRYGGSVGEDLDYRLTASGFKRDEGHRQGAPEDGWWLSRIQGRADWRPSDADRVTLTGEVFGGEVDQTRSGSRDERADRWGASLLSRWEHDLSDDSGVAVQLWYEYTDLWFTVLRELRHTVDLDLEHHFRFRDRHEVTWGGAYRFSHDDEIARGVKFLDPESRGLHLVTGFVQDRITLWPDRLDLTLGSKLEYNQLSGIEVQPSARAAFTPNDWNTLWASFSRAVRTPTRLEHDLTFLRGDRFDPEKVLATELGYRVQPHPSVSLDLATFYNRYEDLLTAEPGRLGNQLEGYSYGGELAGWWQVRPWWRLHASYSFLEIRLDTDSGSADASSEGQKGNSPEHQVFLRSSFDLPRGFELDAMLRYVDDLPNLGVSDYVEMDLRLGWRFWEVWELAVVGQNLLQGHHREGSGTTVTGVQRGVYGQLRWRWGEP